MKTNTGMSRVEVGFFHMIRCIFPYDSGKAQRAVLRSTLAHARADARWNGERLMEKGQSFALRRKGIEDVVGEGKPGFAKFEIVTVRQVFSGILQDYELLPPG